MLHIIHQTKNSFILHHSEVFVLTQSSHFFGQVSSKPAEKVTAGQQVKRRVALHGVKGERIHGARKARHVTHLVFSVCCHCEAKCCSRMSQKIRGNSATRHCHPAPKTALLVHHRGLADKETRRKPRKCLASSTRF